MRIYIALAAALFATFATTDVVLAQNADDLATQGQTIVANDDALQALRQRLGDDEERRGFDIAAAAAGDEDSFGRLMQTMMSRFPLPESERGGFKVGAEYLTARNAGSDRLRVASAALDSDPGLARIRMELDDPRARLGFDVAIAIYGDPASGAQGNTSVGPGAIAIRASLSIPFRAGFDLGMCAALARRDLACLAQFLK